MNNKRTYPYTSDDIRAIADRLDEIIGGLGSPDLEEESDWLWGVTVEVWHEDQVVGHVKAHGDGWMGFYPLAVTGD